MVALAATVPSVGHDADAAVAGRPEVENAQAVGNLDVRSSCRVLRKGPRDPLAGRGASGVDDAPVRVSSFEPEPLVELDPHLGEIDDARRRLLGENPDSARTAQPAAGGERIRRVQCGGVAGVECGSDPTLGEPARR